MSCQQPADPTSDPGATCPAGSATTTCPKCAYWSQNHHIDFQGHDTKFVSSTQFSGTTVEFRLETNLASSNITVTSTFKWGTVAADIKATEKANTITQFKSHVAAWGNRFKMKIVDPICGEKTIPIQFRLLWSPDDTTSKSLFKVNLHRTYPRAGVTGWNINIGYDSNVTAHAGWTLAHEYGHTLCLKDEYFYGGVTSATVTYKKADGSSEPVTLEPSSGNIMFTHSNTTYLKRFYYFTAIEAQELLRQKSGRSVTCEVI